MENRSFPISCWGPCWQRVGDRLIPSVAGGRAGVRCRWPVPAVLSGVQWPVCSGRRGGVSVRRYDYHNYNDGYEDEDYDFSNYGYCGLGACALVIEHGHSYGLGMDALVIGRSQTGTILWFGHGCSGHQMQWNMSIIMVWAWILWSPAAVEHEHYQGLGMDALVIGRRMQSNMNVIVFWAWMLWSSDAVEHEHYCGLGMDALVIGCSRT